MNSRIRKRLRLDAKSVPDHLPNAPLEDFLARHRYLLLTIGIVWRVFGLSWPVLAHFHAFVLGLCGVLVFLLCRIRLNRYLSALCALLFVTAPCVLRVMPSPRDFCRTPFLLAAMGIVGMLIWREMSSRGRVLWALIAGVVLGVGIGFRQDAIVMVPIVVLALGLGGWIKGAGQWRGRVAAVLLFFAAFVLTGYPILAILASEGSPTALHMMTGMSTALPGGPWSTAVLLRTHLPLFRCLCLRHICRAMPDASWRERGDFIFFMSPLSERAYEGFVAGVVRWLPADFYARGLASSLFVFSDIGVSASDFIYTNPIIQWVYRYWLPLSRGFTLAGWFVPWLVLSMAAAPALVSGVARTHCRGLLLSPSRGSNSNTATHSISWCCPSSSLARP